MNTETENQSLTNAFFEFALSLADSDLIHAQRLIELCSKGPELETDIALSNIGLDFMGQARLFYQEAAKLSAEPTDEDKLAYLRDERGYRNNLLVELPNGNFAHTVVKQFLLDAFRQCWLDKLCSCELEWVAGIAAKAVKENAYHLRFSGDWLIRLGDGTEESHRKTREALDFIWPYSWDLFCASPAEKLLADEGLVPNPASCREDWLPKVRSLLQEAALEIPEDDSKYTGGKEGRHTEYLGPVLADLQYLQRAYPGLEW